MRDGGTQITQREGVLLGAKLHKPSRLDEPVSEHPGFGRVQTSLCGRFQGIAYERSWVESHWPDAPMCKWCDRG